MVNSEVEGIFPTLRSRMTNGKDLKPSTANAQNTKAPKQIDFVANKSRLFPAPKEKVDLGFPISGLGRRVAPPCCKGHAAGVTAVCWFDSCAAHVTCQTSTRLCPFISEHINEYKHELIWKMSWDKKMRAGLLGKKYKSECSNQCTFVLAQCLFRQNEHEGEDGMTGMAAAGEPTFMWSILGQLLSSARMADLSLAWRDPNQRDLDGCKSYQGGQRHSLARQRAFGVMLLWRRA